MEKLKPFLLLCNTVLPFADFLYILQLEEYSTKRLLHWLPRFFFRRNIQRREKLVLTRRVLLMLALSVGMLGLSALLAVCLLRTQIFIALLLLCFLALLVPFYVLIANVAFTLVEEVFKKKLRQQATVLVAKNPQLKVVAITGSYGKTTVKNFVYQLTRYSYKTQMIPGNINTPGGIANWIIRNLNENTELLIAEVDAYKVGEIAKSCDILNADIAVLTNIGDQHLQRFGNQNELAEALTEVFTHSKTSSTKISTLDTKVRIPAESNDLIFLKNEAELKYKGKLLATPQLSKSNIINLSISIRVAEFLDIPHSFIKDTVTSLELPERRQQVGTVLGYEGIDDSYNISFTTAQAGIAAAKEFATQKRKKLLVVTAGIPELSNENKNKNKELGKQLSSQADFTIILGSMFVQEIASGFESPGKYRVVPTLKHFLSVETQNFEKDEWVLLLQPELNDLYY